jgi:stage II sporulation protein M
MKKRGEHFNFRNEASKSFRYITESRNYVFLVLGVFILSALVAVIFSVPSGIQVQIQNYIKEILEKTSGMNFFEMFFFIFLNNVKSSLIGMISGIVFGIPSLLVTIVNGYFLGFIAMLSVNSEGIFVLWRLFPHGIFELPAVFISLGLGIKIGFSFFQKKKESMKKILLKSLKVFAFVVLPLLFIAAIIESILIFCI